MTRLEWKENVKRNYETATTQRNAKVRKTILMEPQRRGDAEYLGFHASRITFYAQNYGTMNNISMSDKACLSIGRFHRISGGGKRSARPAAKG